MQKSKLYLVVGLLVVVSMVLASCAPAATGAKSKDPTSFVAVTFSEPETFDPALDYETAGSEIIQNVYENLVWYKRESTKDLIPMLATEIPTVENGGVSADGLTYTFKIRKGVNFHTGEEMTVEDVAYSLQRGLLQGGTSSPMWLNVEPILGSSDNNDIVDQIDPKFVDALNAADVKAEEKITSVVDDPAGLNKIDPAELKRVCEVVTSKIVADKDKNTVTIKLAQPWGPFLVSIAGPWSVVQQKKWVAANGGWDGDCATWQKYYGKTSDELNKTALGKGENGTGPYMLDKWTEKESISLKAFDGYWRKEPMWEGGPSGAPKLKKVTIKYIDEFATRLAAFQAGDADFLLEGSSQDWPQLDPLAGEMCEKDSKNCKPTELGAKSDIRAYKGLPTINRTDVYFNFAPNVEGGNNFLGSGKLDGNGIPPEFFSDEHIRKAFNYCFDWGTYIKDVQQGEGKQANNVMIFGEIGDNDTSPKYNFDIKKCEEEFKAATLKSSDGKSVWDSGFRFTLSYNTGNTQRQTIAQILQQNVAQVNPNFKIEVSGIEWASFLKEQKAKKLPMFIVGWQEDIPDPHNWTFTYTLGYSGSNQKMPKEFKDKIQPLVQKGVNEPDPLKRAAIYADFNKMYYDFAPTILLAQQYVHHYEHTWVKGYYRNPTYGQWYYYALSKD
ncbi:MAG: ABC transporter substrate-binding protein [Leptolinea sp.]